MKSSPARPTRLPDYPKPLEQGGHLIRGVIRDLRLAGFELPITSHILIAVSGGSDSVALARLMVRYGRRAAAADRIRLLHINHGWRGQASDADEAFVRQLAKELGVPVIVHRLKALPDAGESWENAGRIARKKIFAAEAKKHRALVWTAHTADDRVETVLWRIMTGKLDSHGEGILVRHGVELRPVLAFKKEELRRFLQEEGQVWREDATNLEGRFLRSRIRTELWPVVERIFPTAHEHLLALSKQYSKVESDQSNQKKPKMALSIHKPRPKASAVKRSSRPCLDKAQ